MFSHPTERPLIGFALVQWKQYGAKGKWADYIYGKRRYIVLSFVAKSLLAWQVFAGALAA